MNDRIGDAEIRKDKARFARGLMRGLKIEKDC
jgi:hypothetical protein